MSFVEKALRKMQQSGRLPADRFASNDFAAPEQRAGELQRAQPGLAARQPARQPARPAPARSGRVLHIDRHALRVNGLAPPQSQEHELADQYRAIKRPLIDAAFDPAAARSAQIIMTASALAGDGKTFNCVNLALSMALEKDHSVLLVDGDVAKPHISKVLGVSDEPGLLDALVDAALDIESLVIPTDTPRLSVLPAGRYSDTAPELLASQRMAEIAQRLAALDPRGLVLFDSPPILLTSEARALANAVGQVVLVVRAGVTPQQAVKDAIEALGAEKNVRLVLNQVELSGPVGYYYGHRYGYHRPSESVRTESHGAQHTTAQ